jgi:predicted nicotinamide N-methyase
MERPATIDCDYAAGPVDEVRRALERRFSTEEEPVEIGRCAWKILHPRSADELLDEAEKDPEQRIPYWAEIWPSSRILAERLLKEQGAGRRLLELGCGVGPATLAALEVGFQVTATDYFAEALGFTRINALSNGLPAPNVVAADWRTWPTELAGFDVVVGADILYEKPYPGLVAEVFRAALRPGAIGWVTDPCRQAAESFPAECEARGLVATVGEPFRVYDEGVWKRVRRYEVRWAG